MTQNNLINQIVEVLDRYTHEDFINVDFVVFKSDFQEVATEIASLHPLTKIIEEIERLRDEAQLEKYKSETTLAKVLRDGKISAFNQVLSLLTQGNYEGISVSNNKFKCSKCSSDWGEVRATCFNCGHESEDLST